MERQSQGRRSSSNPVRIPIHEREDKGATRTDTRRTQTTKPKITVSSADGSHIPRPRLRASSSDRASIKRSSLKPVKTQLHQYVSATPNTPVSNASKRSLLSVGGSSNRIAAGLPTGPRSLSGDRASSSGAKGPRKDTRPIADKTYQAQMLAKIDAYFSANQCLSMLNSNGSLKPVTLKMFVEVSAYLVRILDIKQALTMANYVEELPKIAKKLHYPGIMTKSWLKTANAMHSWPNVLAWTSWLVQVCEIRDLAFKGANLDNLPFVGTEKQANVNKNSFFSMIKSYNAWNEEKLDEEAALVDNYLRDIQNERGATEDDLRNARSSLEEEQLKLKAAEENAIKLDAEVKQLKEMLSSLQNDEAKQLKDIAAKEEYIKTTNFEADQINAEAQKLCKQLVMLNEQHDELISTIKEQPMSRVERNKILEKCTEIRNYMQQFDDYLQDIQKEIYTIDIKLASVNNNFNKAVLTYNKEILLNFKCYDNIVGMDLEELKMPEKVVVHLDIMEVLNAKSKLLNDLRELLKNKLGEQECLIHTYGNELEVLQDRIKALEDEYNDMAEKMKERKAYISKIKREAKDEEKRLKEQVKTLQDEIKEIEESTPDMQKVLADLKDETDKLEALRLKQAFIEESATLFFKKLYEILGHHKNELSNILKRSRDGSGSSGCN